MTRTPISGIEVFLAIVREGSLRAAARSLGVGAPAVSHQLKALERRIGVDLLVRTTRSIELTDAGRALLAGAAPAFEEIIDAIEGTREIGKSNTGTLRLTLPRSAYKMIIAPVLADFQAQYPDVCLDLSIDEGLVDIEVVSAASRRQERRRLRRDSGPGLRLGPFWLAFYLLFL